MPLGLLGALRPVGALLVFVAGAVTTLRRRRRHPGEADPMASRPPRSGAQLAGRRCTAAILAESDLRYGNLEHSRLDGAALDDRDLTGCTLAYARMNRARIAGGNLEGADLSWASLRSADLTAARLDRARLIETDLRGADLRGAVLHSSIGLASAHLDGAIADRTTSWPPGFDPLRAGVRLRRTE